MMDDSCSIYFWDSTDHDNPVIDCSSGSLLLPHWQIHAFLNTTNHHTENGNTIEVSSRISKLD